MIGTRPVADLAPLEYRYGLDAAMLVLAADRSRELQPLVLCNVPELIDEVRQRLPYAMRGTEAAHSVAAVHAALWIEPLAATWEADLGALAGSVQAGGRLVVIASQPLARLLGERSRRGDPHLWGQGGGMPAGMRIGGIHGLLQRLASAGFYLEVRYGLHSVPAMAANWLSRQLERWGRPDLGDRLHFWARLHYCSGDGGRGVLGLPAGMSTVALLVASKVAG